MATQTVTFRLGNETITEEVEIPDTREGDYEDPYEMTPGAWQKRAVWADKAHADH